MEVPGMIMVWKPMMKMTFMGPKEGMFIFVRLCRQKPSLVTKAAQNQKILAVTAFKLAICAQRKSSDGERE